VKVLKRRAYGYRNDRSFLLRIEAVEKHYHSPFDRLRLSGFERPHISVRGEPVEP
jgi:hypothetical protein